MELTLLLIFGLATWRIASLLVNEAGPGDLFLKLRNRAGFTHGFEKEIVIIPEGFWGELFSCIWCCSLWVGAGWTGVYILSPNFATLFASPFALSAVAILVNSCTER